jgi:hypothetical protein
MDMDFRWIPGQGVDLGAVERMKQHFPKPTEAPYEAWFMSGTLNIQEEFLTTPIKEIGARTLVAIISDWYGGLKNFGRYDIWVVWFHHLLPQILAWVAEDTFNSDTLCLHVNAINFLINLYPVGIIQEEYPGFREDVLRTVPQVIMLPQLWQGGDMARTPDLYDEWEGYWPCPIYSALFFCLAYLHPPEIRPWVASIAAIDGADWRGEINKWLRGAQKFFHWIEHPSEVANKIKGEPTIVDYLGLADIHWSDTFGVFHGIYSSRNLYDYIPKVNIETFWAEVSKYPALSVQAS